MFHFSSSNLNSKCNKNKNNNNTSAPKMAPKSQLVTNQYIINIILEIFLCVNILWHISIRSQPTHKMVHYDTIMPIVQQHALLQDKRYLFPSDTPIDILFIYLFIFSLWFRKVNNVFFFAISIKKLLLLWWWWLLIVVV